MFDTPEASIRQHGLANALRERIVRLRAISHWNASCHHTTVLLVSLRPYVVLIRPTNGWTYIIEAICIVSGWIFVQSFLEIIIFY